METRCFLRTLGPPALLGPTGDPVRFRVKKHLALLAYLAVEPTTAHRREALADFLWPLATASEGRHSLATALSVLRSRIGRAAFETTRDTIRLTGHGLELDLTRLASGDVLGDDVRRPLEVGAFLDGLDIPDADEFLRWKDRHQARLLPSILEAMVVLIDRCRRTADSRQMERIADRMLGLDSLSEDAVRAKMEARALAGDRVTALRAFEDFRTQLAEDLKAAPSIKLERLAVRLRRRGWERTDGPSVAPVPPVATEQWRGRPFIGRASEHRVLYEAWERTQKREPGHVLVRGDSGIGKTTIVERLTTAAVLEGATSSRVQCYELEREIPYAAVTGLIIGLLDKPGASATPPESLAELARTIPEVRRRYPAIPAPIESQGETARVRLTDAMHDLVSAIAEEHPVILIVDDLHFADDASLAVLHLLLRRGTQQPLMLILTVRQGELGRSPQALRLLESTAALGFAELSLTPLPDGDAAELLDSLVPSDQRTPGAAARRALLAAAAGYPMVLELLVQDWQANGDHSLALSLGAMTAELHAGGRSQAGAYEPVFERILQSIDGTTRAVLNLAAILGHRLNALQMYSIVDLGLGQAMHGLSELSKLRVVRDGDQRMEFINELMRACAYRAVPSPIRRQLHSEVADWLLKGKLGAESASGLELAWHCMRAGRQAEAIPHLLAGGREAMHSGAPHETELALESALPALPEPANVEARLLLVEAIQEQGRYVESLDHLQTLCDQASDGDRTLVLRTAANIYSRLMTLSELTVATRHMIDLTKHAPHPITRLRAAQVASVALNELRDRGAANELENAISQLPTVGYSQQEWLDWFLVKMQAQFFQGKNRVDTYEAMTVLERKRPGTIANSTTVRLSMTIGSVSAGRGHYDEAIGHHEHAYEMAIRIGRDRTAAACASNLAICYLRVGNVSKQLQWADTCLRISTTHFSHINAKLHAVYCRALALAVTSSARSTRDYLRNSDQLVDARAPTWMQQLWHLFRADVVASLGAAKEAEAIARPAVDFRSLGPLADHYLGTYCRWCARIASGMEEREAARNYLIYVRKELESLDALDQAEVLLATRLLTSSGSGTDLDDELQRHLAKLPPGVAGHFERLGLLTQAPAIAV